MTTVALTRCAYGITLPAGVNNVWTSALRCWANRKSCHVLTLRESSHPLINYEKTERGLLQSGSIQVFRVERKGRQTEQTKVNKLHALSPVPKSTDLSAHKRLWYKAFHTVTKYPQTIFLLCLQISQLQIRMSLIHAKHSEGKEWQLVAFKKEHNGVLREDLLGKCLLRKRPRLSETEEQVP